MSLQESPNATDGLALGTWLVDPNAGHIGFAVKTMWGLSEVKGTFDRFEGALKVTEAGSTGELVVHTDSLDTKNPKRDTHLRSADFFDSQSHPLVSFAATAVDVASDDATISGVLTVGPTRAPLSFHAKVERSGTDALTLRATQAVARHDVGLTWNRVGIIRGDARLDVELRLLAPTG